MFLSLYLLIFSIIIILAIIFTIVVREIKKEIKGIKRHIGLTNKYLEEICKELNLNWEALNDKIINDNIIDIAKRKRSSKA